MPPVSEKQRRAMYAAAEGKSTLGIPQEVGKEFVGADDASNVNNETVEVEKGIFETELDVAKGIREGDLPSPIKYENIWLFDVRVTGTGTAYRSAHDEYVYRPPEHFLTDEFIERCNGLPLICLHCDESPGTLNTEQFRERIIGIVILPYIKGDEVWGIAKVYDEDGARLMRTVLTSTSPAVVFRQPESTAKIQIDESTTVLIEGKPSLLDHLAICEQGVWDKGGEPNGVNNHGEVSMTDEQKQEQAPAWFDSYAKAQVEQTKAITARLDSMEEKMCDKRMDADEKEEKEEDKESRKDSEESKSEDKKDDKEAKERTDADEEKLEEKAKEYADSAAAKLNAELQAQIKELESKLSVVTKPRTHEDRLVIANAQLRADAIMQMHKKQAPLAMFDESARAYRNRLADELKTYSPEFKAVKLDSLDEISFKVIEDRIYADAEKAAKDSAKAQAGVLIPVVREDAAGRKITSFIGDPDAWMSPFKTKGKLVQINRPASVNGRVA